MKKVVRIKQGNDSCHYKGNTVVIIRGRQYKVKTVVSISEDKSLYMARGRQWSVQEKESTQYKCIRIRQ